MGQCTAPCKMLAFRARTIMRDPDNIELVHLKKKEAEGKCFGHFTALQFGNAFGATRSLVGYAKMNRMLL